MVEKDNIFLKRTNLNEGVIVVKGKFKACNLYNNTLHIILYPDDGLQTAVDLQDIKEWSNVTLNIKKNA
jgi:hypothetical protein